MSIDNKIRKISPYEKREHLQVAVTYDASQSSESAFILGLLKQSWKSGEIQSISMGNDRINRSDIVTVDFDPKNNKIRIIVKEQDYDNPKKVIKVPYMIQVSEHGTVRGGYPGMKTSRNYTDLQKTRHDLTGYYFETDMGTVSFNLVHNDLI